MPAYLPLLPLFALLSGVGVLGAAALVTHLRRTPPASPAPVRSHRTGPSPAIDLLLAAAAANPRPHGRHRLNEDVDTTMFAAIEPATTSIPAVAVPEQRRFSLVKSA